MRDCAVTISSMKNVVSLKNGNHAVVALEIKAIKKQNLLKFPVKLKRTITDGRTCALTVAPNMQEYGSNMKYTTVT